MSVRRFLFLQSSARDDGNAQGLARLAAAGLPADTDQEWRDLARAPLPPFEDHRHDGGADSGPQGGYGKLTGLSRALAEATLAASDLVFVAPLYWYGLPAPAKLYLDHWSHWLRAPGLEFKARMAGKRMWLVMAHSGSSPAEIAPALDGLKLSAAYMGMIWAGALLVDANRPGDWRQDAAAVAAAAGFFAG